MRYLRKKVKIMNITTIERYCPVSESLKESLKEMKLIRQGKLPKKTMKDMWREIEEEDESHKE